MSRQVCYPPILTLDTLPLYRSGRESLFTVTATFTVNPLSTVAMPGITPTSGPFYLTGSVQVFSLADATTGAQICLHDRRCTAPSTALDAVCDAVYTNDHSNTSRPRHRGEVWNE